MRERKLLFEKRNKLRLAIPFNFPQDIPSPWGISYEYLPGWLNRTRKKSSDHVCVILFSKIFKVMYHKVKISLNSRSSHQSCSREKAVPKNFAISTGKRLCWSLLLIDLRASTFLKREYCKILHVVFL